METSRQRWIDIEAKQKSIFDCYWNLGALTTERKPQTRIFYQLCTLTQGVGGFVTKVNRKQAEDDIINELKAHFKQFCRRSKTKIRPADTWLNVHINYMPSSDFLQTLRSFKEETDDLETSRLKVKAVVKGKVRIFPKKEPKKHE